jgi:hypothetical protein
MPRQGLFTKTVFTCHMLRTYDHRVAKELEAPPRPFRSHRFKDSVRGQMVTRPPRHRNPRPRALHATADLDEVGAIMNSIDMQHQDSTFKMAALGLLPSTNACQGMRPVRSGRRLEGAQYQKQVQRVICTRAATLEKANQNGAAAAAQVSPTSGGSA